MSGWAPVYLYWALIFLGVLPLASINRVAAIVVAARIAAQTTYDLGFPEPQTQTVIYGFCTALAVYNARHLGCWMAAILFVPLAGASAFQLVSPVVGYWLVYWLAVLQALLLIADGESKMAIREWLKASDPNRPDMMHRLMALLRARALRHA